MTSRDRTKGSFTEDPGVFGAAALGAVDDEGAAFEGDAGEAAGDDGDAVAVEDVGAEIDVAGFEGVADETGGAGEGDGGLGDVVAGVGLDAAGEVFALFGGGLRADEHAVAAGLADRLDDELLEVREDVLAFLSGGS